MSSEIMAAIDALRAELHALRIDLATQRHDGKTPRQVRLERRHAMLRELADATGPISMATAEEVEAILDGRRGPPKDQRHIVEALQKDPETPLSIRGIWRVISCEN